MGLKQNQANLTITVAIETHTKLHNLADEQGLSVSKMLAEWILAGAACPVDRAGKVQSVRKFKDELMVSLPWPFLRTAGLVKGSRIRVAYGQNSLILTSKKVSK